MRFSKSIVLGSLPYVAASSAFATSNTNLSAVSDSVRGSCVPTFASLGVVDYGSNISSDDLNATAVTSLGAPTSAYTISCGAPIRLLNNRLNSASFAADTHYDIGQKGSVKTGFYTVAQLIRFGHSG